MMKARSEQGEGSETFGRGVWRAVGGAPAAPPGARGPWPPSLAYLLGIKPLLARHLGRIIGAVLRRAVQLPPHAEPQSPPATPQPEPSTPSTTYVWSDAESDSASDANEDGREPQKTLPEALCRTNLAGPRFRKSCYFEATLRWGAKGFAPYNHMLLPLVFSSMEDEYQSLRNDVCLWDVAVERQIEVAGEDALQLVELLTPRVLGTMKVGDARYAVMTDEEGMVVNDPVVLRVAEDRFWFSIADSDMLFWIKGLALGRGLKVTVSEPDVSPLAVQGPKSLPLLKELLGDWVESLKPFGFREADLDGIPMLLCRSGWSPERGYELFLTDGARGDELWEKIMGAGHKYGIKPGSPNHIRRIEGGTLSLGSDVTPKNSILELGLPPTWCFSDKALGVLGRFDTFSDVLFTMMLYTKHDIEWFTIWGHKFDIPGMTLQQWSLFAVVFGVYCCQAIPGMYLLVKGKWLPMALKFNEFLLLLAITEIEYGDM